MPEIAPNVKRIYPKGVAQDEYMFAADTVPPRFAVVGISDNRLWVTRPLTREQRDVHLRYGDEDFLSDEDRETDAVNSLGYVVDTDDIMYAGEYPGGRDRMALNLGRFVLGA